MGQLSRLGAGSRLRNLEPEVLRLIVEHEWGNNKDALETDGTTAERACGQYPNHKMEMGR
jgi:hypothetical protein